MTIQASDERLVDSLYLQIFGNAEEEGPAFLLIDPASKDPLRSESEFASRWKDAPKQVIPVHGWPSDKCPYLFSLLGRSSLDVSAALQFAWDEAHGRYDDEEGQVRSLCAWLFPFEADVKRLGSRMAQRAAALSPKDSAAVVFRYWDPRLVAHLPRVLDKAIWRRHLELLGLRRWLSLVEVERGVEIADLPEVESKNLSDIAGPLAWRFDLHQWRNLEILSWRNRLIQCSASWALETVPRPDSLESIACRALDHGFSEESDILRFAHCVLTVHPQFDSHPDVIADIQKAQRAGQPGFTEIVGNWSEDFVAELESGSWLKSTHLEEYAS